jgi:hypothetical protein
MDCPKFRRVVRSDFTRLIILEESIGNHSKIRPLKESLPEETEKFIRRMADVVGYKGTARLITDRLTNAVIKGDLPTTCLLNFTQVLHFLASINPIEESLPLRNETLSATEIVDASLDAFHKTRLSSAVQITYTSQPPSA